MASMDEMGNTLKKGSTELLILAILETRESHGYEISRQIQRSLPGCSATMPPLFTPSCTDFKTGD